ncbi:MAG: DUF4410 domain-containing protein [Syntrophobacteraceae bacterium]
MRFGAASAGSKVVLALICFGILAGCTFKRVHPEVFRAPTQKYAIMAVGEVSSADKLYEHLALQFRRGFIQKLRAAQAFETVQDPAVEPVPESAVLFSGQLTNVEKGSTAMRWIVGMGAGKAYIMGRFTITSPSGEVLAKFDAHESYLGGAGIGGANLLDMDDLARKFGETVAEKTIKWSRGDASD